MDFKTMFTKATVGKRRSGFTLLEIVFSVGVTTLCLGSLASFFLFSTHSFTTLYNYVDLDDANRIAMDQLTRDVRQANSVKSYTTNNLVLADSDGLDLSYTYDPIARTLIRSKNSVDTVILRECDR